MKWKRKALGYVLVFLMAFSSIFALNAKSVYAEGTLGAPTDLRAASENRMVLEWTAVPNATAYVVYRSEDGGKNWTWLDATTGTSYVDSNAVPGRKYLYQTQSMREENGQWIAGEYSEWISATLDLKPPVNLQGTSANGQVTLTWNQGSSSYVGIMRSDSLNGTYVWKGVVSGNSFTDATVEVNKTYYYKIYTASLIGNTWGPSSDCSAAVQVYVTNPWALSAPTDVSVENKNDSGLVISWKPGANANAYLVYRSEDGGKNWKRLDVTSANSYTDTTAGFGQKYSYRVDSMRYANGQWEAGPNATKRDVIMLPVAPEQLSVSPGVGNQAVKLSWQAKGKASVFGICRAESQNGKYTWISSVQGNSFTDTGLTVGKTYYYKVYAAIPGSKDWYNGDYSKAVSGAVQGAPTGVNVQPDSLTSVKVAWNAAPGATHYIVWRVNGANMVPVGTTDQTSFVSEGLSLNTTYKYRVQSINFVDGNWGYGATSQTVSGQTGLAVPQNFSVKQDGREYYGIRLSWSPVKNAGTYGILRSEHGANKYEWIGTTSLNSYLDQPGVQGKQYDYKIYAAVCLDFLGKDPWVNSAYTQAASAAVRKESDGLIISNVQITDVTGDGYWVSCEVASPYTVTSVTFPAWTTANGQDDILWKSGNVDKGFASCYIKTSEHGYAVGQYETCIYATDASGKTVGIQCGVTTVPLFSSGSGTGWYDTDGSSGTRYYLVNGTAVTGWRYIGGLKYYFYPNGALCQNVEGIIGRQSRYVIKINKQMNCLTVYASDGANGYIIPVKSMLCSTGDDTPLGTFYTPEKYRWRQMLNGSYAQFATRLTAGQQFLMHSLTYDTKDPHTLMAWAYNGLGVLRSAGCIRLQAGNAYWIYANCPIGTQVEVYNSSNPGPFYRPLLVPIPGTQNYDPTDPFI